MSRQNLALFMVLIMYYSIRINAKKHPKKHQFALFCSETPYPVWDPGKIRSNMKKWTLNAIGTNIQKPATAWWSSRTIYQSKILTGEFKSQTWIISDKETSTISNLEKLLKYRQHIGKLQSLIANSFAINDPHVQKEPNILRYEITATL